MCFLVSFAKFLRAPFLQNTAGRLLLTLWNLELEWNDMKRSFSLKKMMTIFKTARLQFIFTQFVMNGHSSIP